MRCAPQLNRARCLEAVREALANIGAVLKPAGFDNFHGICPPLSARIRLIQSGR
jgi:hypothetical protein